MRRPSTAQLELPLVADAALVADPADAVPDARPASECSGCGWLREGAAACPVCRAPAPATATPRRKLPPRRVV